MILRKDVVTEVLPAVPIDQEECVSGRVDPFRRMRRQPALDARRIDRVIRIDVAPTSLRVV
jgi:hypothetical protein